MTAAPRRPPWLLILLLVSPGAVLPAGASAPTHRTLTRLHDPVILRTSLLHALPDRRTANLRLYSARSGVLAPIPFQFDARDDEGDVVFSEKDLPRPSTFDDNDDFIFMAKDTGDRLKEPAFPTRTDAVLEIAVTDPITGEQRMGLSPAF